jgi:hypothetical protein
VARPARADQPRQPVRPHPGQKGLSRSWEPEDGVGGGNADITGDDQLQPSTEAVSLDTGENRLVQRLDRAQGELRAVKPRARDLARGEVREVQPRAEGSALARQQDNADGPILLHLPGGREHVVGPVAALSVQHPGAVEADLTNGAALVYFDSVHGSVRLLSSSGRLRIRRARRRRQARDVRRRRRGPPRYPRADGSPPPFP